MIWMLLLQKNLYISCLYAIIMSQQGLRVDKISGSWQRYRFWYTNRLKMNGFGDTLRQIYSTIFAYAAESMRKPLKRNQGITMLPLYEGFQLYHLTLLPAHDDFIQQDPLIDGKFKQRKPGNSNQEVPL